MSAQGTIPSAQQSRLEGKGEETYGDLRPNLAEADVDITSESVRDQEHNAHCGIRRSGFNHQCSDTSIEACCGVAHSIAHCAREQCEAEDDHEGEENVEGDSIA